MSDASRLQVKTNADPEAWADVGAGSAGVPVPVTVEGGITVSTGDIEIGAVEIKNSTDDTRATVGALGLYVDVQPLPTIFAGTKTVPTGTAETVASSQIIHSVTIKALSTNTASIYVGGSGITVSGFELLAGESVSLDTNNLANVYVISGSVSQIVRYIAI